MLQFPPLLPDSLLPLLHWRQFAEDLAAAAAFGKKRRKKRKKNFPKSKAKECGGGLLLRIYTKKRLALLLDQSVSLKKKANFFSKFVLTDRSKEDSREVMCLKLCLLYYFHVLAPKFLHFQGAKEERELHPFNTPCHTPVSKEKIFLEVNSGRRGSCGSSLHSGFYWLPARSDSFEFSNLTTKLLMFSPRTPRGTINALIER